MISLVQTTKTSSPRFALLLVAAFTIAMGFGVILPVLPFFLKDVVSGSGFSVAWHTGMLTAAYMFSLFASAPLWGYISDRLGRRRVILFGLAGFGPSMVLFGLTDDLAVAYLARTLSGIFAAAVVPVVLAYINDTSAPEHRARGFAWASAANALGFLSGPALSGALASAKFLPSDQALALPFYVAAGSSGLVWLAIYRYLPEPRSRRGRVPGRAERSGPPLHSLLSLSLTVALGMGAFEVGFALQGQQALNLGPRQIGWMFAECSLVMILVQVFLLAPVIGRVGSRLLAPAFVLMAAGVVAMPWATSYPAMLIAIALVAATSGLLIPAIAYFVSLAAGERTGAALGQQTAVASLGQALGSGGAGWLFAVNQAAPFWVLAGLLGVGAVVGFGVSNKLLAKRRQWYGK